MFAILIIFILLLLIRIYVIKNTHAWNVMYYVSATFIALFLIIFGPSSQHLMTCERGPLDSMLGDLYYQMQIAFYCASIVLVISIDKKDKDINNPSIIIHHIVTFSVIVTSQMFKYQKIGFTVLFLHDTSDIYLYASKFAKKRFGKAHIFTQILFAIFASTFALLRLVAFPYFVFVQCLPTAETFVHYFCIACLSALMGLHIYWFARIVKIAKKFNKRE